MYEVTFIVNEEKDSASVQDLLTAASGKVISEKKWGKRTLSYPIAKLTSAYYLTWTVDIDDKKLADLKNKMTYDEKLIRFLLLKVETDSLKPTNNIVIMS